jgi:DNA-binding XRE family transcriptional regulator
MHSQSVTLPLRAPANPTPRGAELYHGRNSKPVSSLDAHRLRSLLVQETKAVTDLLPVDISARFGLRLRELRRSRNITQLRMAVDFGIDRSFISDVERGKKSISLVFLEVIALGLKIELSEMLRGL